MVNFKRFSLIPAICLLLVGCATTPQRRSYQLNFVYFYGAPPQATETIDEKSGAVINATQITDLEKNEWALYPNVSPDDSFVVYSVLNKTSYSSNIVISKSQGRSGFARVTSDENYNENPTWYGSDKIIFDSDRLGFRNRNIWITSRDGSGGLKQVTRGDRQYDFKADSYNNNIYFTSFTRSENPYSVSIVGSPYIWSAYIDGGDLTQIRKGSQCKVSPNGKTIVYIDEKQLWVMSIDGSSPTQLTSDKSAKIDPTWSPDGSKIAFSCDRTKQKQFDIWVMDKDGRNLTQLTTNESFDGGPCWSNDGKYIYFHSNRGKKWNIWRLSLQQEQIKDNISSQQSLLPINSSNNTENINSKPSSNNTENINSKPISNNAENVNNKQFNIGAIWKENTVNIELISADLAEVIGIMKSNWKTKAVVTSWYDTRSLIAKNTENVATSRAKAVADKIVALGIDGRRVSYIGKIPEKKGITENDRKMNSKTVVDISEE